MASRHVFSRGLAESPPGRQGNARTSRTGVQTQVQRRRGRAEKSLGGLLANESKSVNLVGGFILINAHHTQLCVLLSSYERSAECVEKHGTNTAAAIKPDGNVLVIAVSFSTCVGLGT